MPKKVTSDQVEAYNAIGAVCRDLAKAIYWTARAEGFTEEPSHVTVLHEMYDACDALRDELEKLWPGVRGRYKTGDDAPF